MTWTEFLTIAQRLPIIQRGHLLAGLAKKASLDVQLSRWVNAGQLLQLRRGVYLLSEPYRKIELYEPYIAAILKTPSYISLEKALEYHGLIPEGVTVYTSVTTKRPTRFETTLGPFSYRHIKDSLFFGYQPVTVNKQTAYLAHPEKALLDLFYLNKIDVTEEYLEQLRLQNVEKFRPKRLTEYALKFSSRKIVHAAKLLREHIRSIKQQEVSR